MVAAIPCKQIVADTFDLSGDEFGLVEKMFITDPRQWQVACLEARRMVPQGIVVRRTGPWVPLVQAGLLPYGLNLSKPDIVRLFDFYDIEGSRNRTTENTQDTGHADQPRSVICTRSAAKQGGC